MAPGSTGTLERLSAEDAAILALERGVVAGHTLKVLVLDPRADGGLPTLEELRARVAAGLDRAPRLRQRLASTPLRMAPPAWVDDEHFALERHVRRAPISGEIDERGLAEMAAAAMRERLDRAHPLWSLDVVERLAGGRMALVWKVHHGMADGRTSMRIGEEILWGATDAEPAPQSWRPAPAPGWLALARAGIAHRLRHGARSGQAAEAPPGGRSLALLRGVVGRELVPGRSRSPFDRRLSAERVVAFASVPLSAIKEVGAACEPKATVNDVVLAAVAGALRRWLLRHHGDLGEVRVKVPVSLHTAGTEADTAANRDSFLRAGLPLGEPDARERLRRIAAETSERKRDHDAQALDTLFSDLRRASPALERFAERLANNPRVFALNVSNVRGPAEPREVAGAPLRELRSLAEISPHHALRVSAISLGTTMSFGLCADPTVVGDLDALAQGLPAELDELLG